MTIRFLNPMNKYKEDISNDNEASSCYYMNELQGKPSPFNNEVLFKILITISDYLELKSGNFWPKT